MGFTPGRTNNDDGGLGTTRSSAKNGIFGRNDSRDPVPKGQPGGNGIFGFSVTPAASGVFGVNDRNDGNGVVGASKDGRGLMGISDNNIGIFARGGQFAGVFEGTVSVSRDILLTNSDCAEDFDISEAGQVEPGTVMVLNEIGEVQPSNQAYDKKVAGIVSGAGNYKPALVLDKKENSPNSNTILPIALIGKVYCKVDASYSSIAAGDLLTTSDTQGHAMKASDPVKAFGAVIGKALRPLKTGEGLIPILIALQ